MKKKLLSLLLAAIMLASMIPVMALASFAEDASATGDPAIDERDTTWYDPEATELVINDVPDFLEFMYQLRAQSWLDDGTLNGGKADLAALGNKETEAQGFDMDGVAFGGVTIKLNCDINLNPGFKLPDNPADLYENPTYMFAPSRQVGFGGTFDGQGHTISGLFISSTSGSGGAMFGMAKSVTEGYVVTVKNVQIKNSWIESKNAGLSTVFSGVQYGSEALVENVYLDVDLVTVMGKAGSPKIGAIASQVGGKLTIKNTVYAGTIDVGAFAMKYVGGAVAEVKSKTIAAGVQLAEGLYKGELVLENYGFYGKCEGDVTRMGKAVSYLLQDTTVSITDSIFAGYMSTTADTVELGHLIGNASLNDEGHITTVTAVNSVVTPVYAKKLPAGATEGDKVDTAVAGVIYNNPGSTTEPKLGTLVDNTSDVEVLENDTTLVGANATLAEYVLDVDWTANADAVGNPMPKTLVTLFGENLKKDFVGTKVSDDDANEGEGENNNNNTTNNNTDNGEETTGSADETTAAPTVNTTAAPVEEEGGCGSTVGIAGIALITTVGLAGAVVARKKKD